MGIFRKELVWALVLMFGSINSGHPLAYMSNAGPELQERFNWTEDSVTWFSTIVTLVAIVGAPLTNLFVPKLGRKKSTFIVSLISAISWILLAITQPSFSWFAYVARVIQGIANGGINSLCSMYIVELAPDDCKGIFGSIHQLGSTIGMCFDYLFAIWCNWWIMAILNAITATVMCVAIWFIPESQHRIAMMTLVQRNHYSKSNLYLQSLHQSSWSSSSNSLV